MCVCRPARVYCLCRWPPRFLGKTVSGHRSISTRAMVLSHSLFALGFSSRMLSRNSSAVIVSTRALLVIAKRRLEVRERTIRPVVVA